jgi:hypothetical protein
MVGAGSEEKQPTYLALGLVGGGIEEHGCHAELEAAQ